MKKYLILIALAFAGIADALYLTIEHYADKIPPCATGWFVDCGKVLRSEYALILGVPLALIGVAHYLSLFTALGWAFVSKKRVSIYWVIVQAKIGFLASLYFVYLQVFVIKSLCQYCMVSAVISTTIFILTQIFFSEERKRLVIWVMGIIYRNIVKKIFFKFDPEKVHVGMVTLGEKIGSAGISRVLSNFLLVTKKPETFQKVAGIGFDNCVGLAAGFDYEARLTGTLAAWGFGFQSVGTITNNEYEGNPRPMLGRLPKSRSLMVNKGYKNFGAEKTIEKLENKEFEIPVGVSIGRTNSKSLVSQKESVDDIVECFRKFENSKVNNSYYELNISCPNLYGDITFYPPKELEELLSEVEKLKIKKPIFIKMPIEKSDQEVLAMLEVISKYTVAGVIFGNLQKDRNDPAFEKSELETFAKGNFSGKPTYRRSNELISLAYKNYKDRFVIIGCGGIFNASDAYEKIQRGATLLQMITGMIFEGPQVVSEINFGIVDLMKRDGYRHISEVIGTKKE